MATAVSDNSGVRIFPPAIYLAGIGLGFLLQWQWPIPIAPDGLLLAVRVVGGLVTALWLGMNIWALATFFRAGTTPNPTRPTTALTFNGPYRFTRNPMYLSLAFLQIGVALLANALWPLLFAIPVLWMVKRIVIDREEDYLERKFGEQYLTYKRRVRRWL
jgi:protein-S-isoprenylcysteine O-methyltransferase Ste14